MDQAKTFDELNRIAAEIEAHEGPWREAWAAMMSLDSKKSGDELTAAVYAATAELNKVIETKIQEIAVITGNNADTLRMVQRPKDEADVMFGSLSMPASQFIRNVAKYQSFNTDYWAAQRRREECDAFAAKVDHSAPVVAPSEAVALMKAGGVPNIRAVDCGGGLNRFHGSALDASMRSAGLLEQYDKTYRDRVSTTQSIAFVIVSGDDERIMVYCEQKTAVGRWEEVQLDAASASETTAPVPRG